MATNEHIIKAPGMLKNLAVGGHLTTADQVLDDAIGKEQSQINAETATAITNEVTRAEAAEELLRQAYEALSQSTPVPVTELPESGEEGVIYRLAGDTSYSDYMWNGEEFIKMAEYDNAIDDDPDSDSENIIKSSGVYNAFKDIRKGFSVYAKLILEAPTAYEWFNNVFIPRGSFVKNTSTKGSILLYEEEDINARNVRLYPGDNVQLEFDVTAERCGETPTTFNLVVSTLDSLMVLDNTRMLDSNIKGVTKVISIGTLNINTTGTTVKIADTYISKGVEFKFRLTGTGNIGRFILLGNNSSYRIKDNCELNVWYNCVAEQNITVFRYSNSNNPNATNIVFEYEQETIYDLVDKNSEKIIQNATFAESNTPYYRVNVDRKIVSNDFSIRSNDGTSVYAYGPFLPGSIVTFSGKLSQNLTPIAKLYELFNYSAGNTENIAIDKDENNEFVKSIVITEELPYLRICCDNYNDPSVMLVETVKDKLKTLDFNNSLVNAAVNLVGNSPYEMNVDSINNNESIKLTGFPYCNKFGDCYQFSCKITNFTSLKICRGYNTYRSRWFEINSTNVNLYAKDTNDSEGRIVETYLHGISSISAMLNVNINIGKDGKAVFKLQTLGGEFSHTFDRWGFEVNGLLQVISNSSLTDVRLSATNFMQISPIWIFGASYMGVTNQRLIGQLKNMGYFKYLCNALAGRASSATLDDIRKSLSNGTPKYLLDFAFANDTSDVTFIANTTAIKELCDKNDVEFIGITLANMPYRNFDVRNAFIRNLGVRYIDLEKAVKDPSKIWSEGTDIWYDGFLSSDNVHPTELGAKAMAMQILTDFPEIMQCYDSHSDTSTPDYDGGDN